MTNFYLAAFNTAWLTGLTIYILWRDNTPRKYSFNRDYSDPAIVKAQPYSKKSGKREPKINDDETAWKKENKLQ